MQFNDFLSEKGFHLLVTSPPQSSGQACAKLHHLLHIESHLLARSTGKSRRGLFHTLNVNRSEKTSSAEWLGRGAAYHHLAGEHFNIFLMEKHSLGSLPAIDLEDVSISSDFRRDTQSQKSLCTFSIESRVSENFSSVCLISVKQQLLMSISACFWNTYVITHPHTPKSQTY